MTPTELITEILQFIIAKVDLDQLLQFIGHVGWKCLFLDALERFLSGLQALANEIKCLA